jgi:hypothetical protein
LTLASRIATLEGVVLLRLFARLHARNAISQLQIGPALQQGDCPLCHTLILAGGQRLDLRLDLGIVDLVTREPWELIQNVQDLQHHVLIFLPHRQLRVEDLITVHLNDTVPDSFVFATLNTSQKLDGNPLLLALHEGCHDLGHAILVQGLGLHAVHILLVVFLGLLLLGAARHHSIPAFRVINTESLDRRVRELGGTLGLGAPTDESSAVGLPAVAGLGVRAVSIHVVVENEFLARLNRPLGEDAHAQLLAYHPFIDIAIGVARVVAEPAQITSLRRIHKLPLVQGHEVEVFDALLVVLSHPSSELDLSHHLPNILEDQLVRVKIRFRP